MTGKRLFIARAHTRAEKKGNGTKNQFVSFRIDENWYYFSWAREQRANAFITFTNDQQTVFVQLILRNAISDYSRSTEVSVSNRQTRLPHDQILKEESYEVLMVSDDGCASVI